MAPGFCTIKDFMAVIVAVLSLARVVVAASQFYASLVFVGKAGA